MECTPFQLTYLGEKGRTLAKDHPYKMWCYWEYTRETHWELGEYHGEQHWEHMKIPMTMIHWNWFSWDKFKFYMLLYIE